MEGRFVNYGSADGLPSGYVYSLAQDVDGFLWVGTRNGLARFDGTGFKEWKSFGRVNALAVDADNRLWVGTSEGLAVKEGNRISEGIRGNVRALLSDSEGFVWATVGDTLLLKLSYAEGIREEARCWYDKRYHEGDYPYFQIYEDAAGNIRPAGRLTHFQRVEDREHPRIRSLSDGNCLGSYAERDGVLYAFDDFTSELCVVSGEKFETIGRLPIAHARLLTDSRGRLWAAGSYGLGLVDPQNPSQTKVYKSASQELFCLFEDRQGNIWVGGDNGLAVLNQTLQQVHPLAEGNITALMEDHTGHLWVGRAEDRVSRIYEDRSGTVYVGLWNNTGFQVWKQGRMQQGVVSGPIPERQWKAASGDRRTSNWISDFLEDSRGRFWVVTWEGVGLNEWDRVTGRTLPPEWLSPEWYPSPETDSAIFLSSRLGSRLIEDASGNLVFGTTEAGLNIIDRETGLVTKYYKGNSSLPDDYVTDLCLTPDGTVWAATRGGLWSPSGAHYLDGKWVQSILADAAGRLWAGTEEGLFFVLPDGSVGRAGKGLGFPSDQYGERVACHLSDGSLAFGGADGAASFHPDSLLALATVPELFLTEFSTEDAGLSFSFSVHDLPSASLLQYRYRVSGVDKEWVTADYPRLQGRYNGLFPGRYTLSIQCTDMFGRWQEPVWEKTFRVYPPLLLRWPFLLFYLLILLVAGWFFLRYRENRQRTLVLQEELSTRNRFFSIISHDLRNPINGMKLLTTALKNSPDDQLRGGLQAIDASVQHTSALLENLLMWSLSQKNVLRPALENVLLKEIVEEAAGDRPIVIEIPDGLVLRTDPNMLGTCIRNLLDNAVRFSPAPGSVRLVADQNSIVISDKGPGMDEQTLKALSRPGHLGLSITRELLDKLGGSLQARNLPDGGCEITILLS